MNLVINGRPVDADAIAMEARRFDGEADADAAARRSLATRALLLDRAGELGLLEDGRPSSEVTFASREAEDDVIARVLDAEVRTPAPTEAECRRYYEQHPERFTAGELVEARHILFAMTPGTPVGALRGTAEKTLAQVKAAPDTFADVARRLSNCPSAEHGGNLGQFGRGEMVPEFERAVFARDTTGVLPELVTTRHGFHVVLVEHRVPGRQVPFEAVRDRIAGFLANRVETRALAQYLRLLAGTAKVEGVDLDASVSPLVQ